MNFNDQGIFGFDISYYQDSNLTAKRPDFNKMLEYGASFVVIRAGQWYWEDEDFVYHWAAAKEAGIPRAAYWFCDAGATGKEQANTFYNILKRNGWDGELLVADYEAISWRGWGELYNFIVELQRLTGLPNEKIAIYTGYYYWMENSPPTGASSDWFAKYPLWLAAYTDKPAGVLVPPTWEDIPGQPFLWQNGTPAIGIAAGVESREIDYDKLNGGGNTLSYYFGSGSTPTDPPPTGEIMETHEGTLNINGLSIRTGPGTQYPYSWPPLGSLKLNDKVYGELDVATSWIHFGRIVRANGVTEVWNGWSSAANYATTAPYMTLRVLPVEPPVEPPVSDVDLTKLAVFASFPIKLVIDGHIYEALVDNAELLYKGKE